MAKVIKITTDQIRELRNKTGAPVMKAKQVLQELKGDMKKAEEVLRKERFEKIAERTDRETKAGAVFTYTHHNQKVVGVVELFCETDFVSMNELFQRLGHDLAMQVASMGIKDFENQEFIKDSSKKISELVKELIAKTGENIKIGRIMKLELGH